MASIQQVWSIKAGDHDDRVLVNRLIVVFVHFNIASVNILTDRLHQMCQ